jgi:hypothetical protein
LGFLLSFRLCVGNRQYQDKKMGKVTDRDEGKERREGKGREEACSSQESGEFKDVPVIPTGEASRNKEELKVSTRARESVMRTGAAG